MKNNYLLFAGSLCLVTAFLHTISGQLTLVNPIMESNLELQQKTELLGVWHMITFLLFVFAYVLLSNGVKVKESQKEVLRLIGWLHLLFAAAFVFASLFNWMLAPQWILFLPMGLLTLLGLKKKDINGKFLSGK